MPCSGPARNVLLVVTGGIAAYKSCTVTRLLQQAGFSVRVVMTEAAQRFVSPMTFEVLSGHPVATDLWGDGGSEALDHIDWPGWADLIVVAPATADLLAKAAGGLADDLASTMLLAAESPLLLAPAMNDRMLAHPATQANLKLLVERGARLVDPETGELACGTTGPGRMAEPERIVAAVKRCLDALPCGESPWRGRRVLVTAGPTREALDPVRFLSNRSTGVFGYALAAEAARLGAEVTLVSGPVDLEASPAIGRVVSIVSAADLAEAVGAEMERGLDWIFMAAAVADFTPVEVAGGKLKKESVGDGLQLNLTRTPDILVDIVAPNRTDGLTVVGFALETEDLLERAAAKLYAKGLDFVVANDPTAAGSGFGDGRHSVHLLGPKGVIWQSDSTFKDALAREILQRLGDDT